MARAVIDIARDFGFDVIAEGVETESQFNFLKKNGCTKFQGYLVGKPMSIEDFEQTLANN
jgi:EAL domain-containing protein (putative c-di-GMP-specific phosphodiesterase class I)